MINKNRYFLGNNDSGQENADPTDTERKMEAVPRLPMLGFELKSSAESVEFAPKLRQVRC